MRNDRVPDPARPRPGLAIQDAGATGSRDCAAATPIECAASARTLEAEADGGGPIALRLALSPVSVGVERVDDCPTRDRHPVASDGVPPVLALEVAHLGRSAEDTRGDPPPYPGDEPGQSAVGCAPHPWRTAQARDRGRAVDGRQVHGEEWARAVADLEDLSAQPCGRHRRDGLFGRADSQLSAALRFGHPQAPTAAADIPEPNG